MARSHIASILVLFPLSAPFTMVAQTSTTTTTTTTTNGSTQSATAACAHEPCTAVRMSRNGAPNPHIHPYVPPTEDQLLLRRLLNVFGEIAGEQRYAAETEQAGDIATAAAIRSRFGRLSGFSSSEVEAIKGIGEKYVADSRIQHDKEIATVQSVKKANPGDHMSRLNSSEIAAVQQEREILWVNLKSDLIKALGPRGFTKLDSYSQHMYDNARISPAQPSAGTSQYQ